jgi:hypothetical protein
MKIPGFNRGVEECLGELSESACDKEEREIGNSPDSIDVSSEP